MKIHHFWRFAVGIGLFVSPNIVFASCTVREAVAKIVVLETERANDVRITRSGEEQSIDARINHYLCVGDRLVRTNQAKVSLQWDGSALRKPMTERSFTIKAPDGWTLLGWVQEQAGRLFAGSSDVALPVRTVSAAGRGGENNHDHSSNLDVPFSHHYGDAQLVSNRREVLAISWRGSPLWVRLISADGQELVSTSPYGQPWTILKLPVEVAMASLVLVEPDGRTHTIAVRRAGFPESEERDANDEGFGSLKWAAEKAFTDSSDWRLEAESILQSKSSESLVADDLWNRVSLDDHHD